MTHIEVYLAKPPVTTGGVSFLAGRNALPLSQIRLARADNGRAVVFFNNAMGPGTRLDTYEPYESVMTRWAEATNENVAVIDADDLAVAEGIQQAEGA